MESKSQEMKSPRFKKGDLVKYRQNNSASRERGSEIKDVEALGVFLGYIEEGKYAGWCRIYYTDLQQVVEHPQIEVGTKLILLSRDGE